MQVKFKMFDIQPEMIRHAKNKKNTTDNEKKNQPIKTDQEMMQAIKMVDKDIKISIINILHMFKKIGERKSKYIKDRYRK